MGLVIAACLTGCGGGAGASDTTTAADDGGCQDCATRPNWHEDVAPLVEANCRYCHTDGGIAPFSMDSYDETHPWSAYMAQQVSNRIMPPWHAVETDQCTPPFPFRHDARMPQEAIDTFVAWANAGAPEGDPANAAPLPSPPETDLADPTVTIPMPGSITIEGEGSTLDFFHCVSFDPGNDDDIYLTGLQVQPGNLEIAHHVLVYVAESAQSAAWPNGIQEDCGGGPGINNATLIAGWVPGAMPTRPPDDVGIRVPAGARLVFNYHYHATGGGPQVDDSTALLLKYETSAPMWTSYFELVGAPGEGTILTAPFLIPAGASNHEEIVEWTVPDFPGLEVRLWTAANHMHKVGVDMTTSLVRDGEETCLLQTPNWDFDWQRLYSYDVPIEGAVQVLPGDVIRVRCTYENTLENTALLETLGELGESAPIDVGLGEGTLDEMCLAGIGVAYTPAP